MNKDEILKKLETADEDCADMAMIYIQLSDVLKEAAIPPTPDAVEAMAVSIAIARENKRRSVAYHSSQTQSPTNTNAAKSEPDKDHQECPTCRMILTRQYPKGGLDRSGKPSKGFFSCRTCKQYVNEDGTTKAWPPRRD